MKLPYTNECYHQMVDCDITCSWLMRLWCRIRCFFIRDYESLVLDEDRLYEETIARQDAREAKFKAKAEGIGLRDLDKATSPADDLGQIKYDDEAD